MPSNSQFPGNNDKNPIPGGLISMVYNTSSKTKSQMLFFFLTSSSLDSREFSETLLEKFQKNANLKTPVEMLLRQKTCPYQKATPVTLSILEVKYLLSSLLVIYSFQSAHFMIDIKNDARNKMEKLYEILKPP